MGNPHLWRSLEMLITCWRKVGPETIVDSLGTVLDTLVVSKEGNNPHALSTPREGATWQCMHYKFKKGVSRVAETSWWALSLVWLWSMRGIWLDKEELNDSSHLYVFPMCQAWAILHMLFHLLFGNKWEKWGSERWSPFSGRLEEQSFHLRTLVLLFSATLLWGLIRSH